MLEVAMTAHCPHLLIVFPVFKRVYLVRFGRGFDFSSFSFLLFFGGGDGGCMVRC